MRCGAMAGDAHWLNPRLPGRRCLHRIRARALHSSLGSCQYPCNRHAHACYGSIQSAVLKTCQDNGWPAVNRDSSDESCIRLSAVVLRIQVFRGSPRIMKDTEINQDQLRRFNVVLFGTPQSNVHVATVFNRTGRMALPIEWADGTVRVGGQSYDAGARQHAPLVCCTRTRLYAATTRRHAAILRCLDVLTACVLCVRNEHRSHTRPKPRVPIVLLRLRCPRPLRRRQLRRYFEGGARPQQLLAEPAPA